MAQVAPQMPSVTPGAARELFVTVLRLHRLSFVRVFCACFVFRAVLRVCALCSVLPGCICSNDIGSGPLPAIH